MDITKSGIVNIIIVAVLSIPLDEQIYDFSNDFLQAHPTIYKLLPILKKLTPNDNLRENKDAELKNKHRIDSDTKPITNTANDIR
ncbi:MAG: hypothetical protein O7C59_05485 [Rickettsia endosymbiont of Ixodes persulcatus]|nr:hypothetical protein [Rickettsia endosymbiont of Ixodes persulcatus]